jgi:hypothetical protein
MRLRWGRIFPEFTANPARGFIQEKKSYRLTAEAALLIRRIYPMVAAAANKATTLDKER